MTQPTLSTSIPPVCQSLVQNILGLLQQLATAENQVMTHSLDHMGNLTELIVKLRENADIVENKKIEKTEESKTMMNNLLSSIDVAETKLDSAIHHLKIAQETSSVTAGQPTEASPVKTPGATQATQAERVRLSGINGTLITLEEILQNIIAKAGDSTNSTNSTSSSGQKIKNTPHYTYIYTLPS